jgi:hypothetical protein
MTVVNGGGGDDVIEYNINAPVSIDGGAGVDTVVVVGTDSPTTSSSRWTASWAPGLNVEYSAIERLDVDGMEGDDRFFVLSTHPRVLTTIIGGLGSDTVDVGGDVTGTIVAQSIEGTSGTIDHVVQSLDPAYNGIYAEGIRLNVAGSQSAAKVLVTESEGATIVLEDGAGATSRDSYTIALTGVPTAPVYMTISAAIPPSSDWRQGAQSAQVSLDGVTWFQQMVVVFGPGALTRTIHVRAVSDTVAEGERIVVVSHAIRSADATYDRAGVRNVEVRVMDDDRPGLIVLESGTGTMVIEDQATDTYTVALTRAPEAGETVTVTLVTDATQVTLSATPLTFTASTGARRRRSRSAGPRTRRPRTASSDDPPRGHEHRRHALRRRGRAARGPGRRPRRRRRRRDRAAEQRLDARLPRGRRTPTRSS